MMPKGPMPGAASPMLGGQSPAELLPNKAMANPMNDTETLEATKSIRQKLQAKKKSLPGVGFKSPKSSDAKKVSKHLKKANQKLKKG